MFRGLPVREARASIHVQPNSDDISGAVKEDPQNCAYARCLKRTLQAKDVFIFRSRAYIQTLDEKGNPIMERFLVKKHARDYIVRFDGGMRVEPGGFIFHAPTKKMTLAYKMQGERLRRASGKKKSPRVREGKERKIRKLSLRIGTGRVHLFGPEDQIR